MQNQQLVDYVKQQIQGGVAIDAIKKALLDAGWPAQDVEDSMKAATPASGTAAAVTTQPIVAAQKKIDPVAALGGSPETHPLSSGASSKTTFFADGPHVAASQEHSWGRVATGVMGVIIVLLLAIIGYMYYSLNGKVATVSGQNASSASETQGLQAQLTKIAQDKTDLTNQIQGLTADNQALMSEVGLFVPQATSTTVTIKGTLATTSMGYVLTTPHMIVLTVKNSKDAKVDVTLKPLVGKMTELTGTHKSGVLEITVTAVNGMAPGAASTSTAPLATSSAPQL